MEFRCGHVWWKRTRVTWTREYNPCRPIFGNIITKLGVHVCHELCDLEWTTIVVCIHYLSICWQGNECLQWCLQGPYKRFVDSLGILLPIYVVTAYYHRHPSMNTAPIKMHMVSTQLEFYNSYLDTTRIERYEVYVGWKNEFEIACKYFLIPRCTWGEGSKDFIYDL